jgi:hypothetical protein
MVSGVDGAGEGGGVVARGAHAGVVGAAGAGDVNAVPWSTLVRKKGRPTVTLTPSSKP